MTYDFNMDRPDWFPHGACRTADPNLFFVGRGKDTAVAKAICAGCPVRVACLDYALAEGIRFGVWGGASERQRRVMRSTGLATCTDATGLRVRPPLPPIRHGTNGGYAAHRRRGQLACEECLLAHTAAETRRRSVNGRALRLVDGAA